MPLRPDRIPLAIRVHRGDLLDRLQPLLGTDLGHLLAEEAVRGRDPLGPRRGVLVAIDESLGSADNRAVYIAIDEPDCASVAGAHLCTDPGSDIAAIDASIVAADA